MLVKRNWKLANFTLQGDALLLSLTALLYFSRNLKRNDMIVEKNSARDY
jgi:hypothetical protein